MAQITEQELLQSIQAGFNRALDTTRTILDAKTSMRGSGRLSSKFVYEVSRAIHTCLLQRSPGLRLRVIKVDERGIREPGEWLVDACIVKEHGESKDVRFIDRIVFAMESESHTGTRAFNEDFAKLVHLDAEHKLYLNGLSQTTPQGTSNYMQRRREYVEAILKRIRPSGEFYLGFWPSPGKPKTRGDTVDSIWSELQSRKWCHLRKIRLWHFDKYAGKLSQV